ncbi:unnamed protein product [Sphagnum jensenii]|uniref:Uncharacterized protein n=1 Tax=Sphagnum jensenii TaxID=128206 RepID=A0ABP1BVN6_9BRYO
MCGVSDCGVFTSVCHGNSDHCLLVVTLQLCLRVPPCLGAFRGVWDAAMLRNRPQATANFCSLLRDRFVLLSPAFLDPEAEWSALERELSEAAGRVVGKARPARRHKPGLTQATLALMAGKHQAHRAKQAEVAENLQRAGHPRQWAQQVKSMAGVVLGRGAPRGEACDVAKPSLQEVADCVVALRNGLGGGL